ncbi:MAG: hypothetical protein IKF46_08375 [Erysipelotrichaceae bacterium]|nr:hypothetical protein [Erysipelotrichaceae bacterium]
MEEKCIFRYSVINAYALPICWIEVLDTGKDNVLVYRFNSKSWNGDTDIIKPEKLTVPETTVRKIRELIDGHPELFGFDELEEPPDTFGENSRFRFISGDKVADISGYNLWYYEDRDNRDVNGREPVRAWNVLAVFNRIRDLLLKVGIDPYYLRLAHEETE